MEMKRTMKTMVANEFEKLTALSGWKREQRFDVRVDYRHEWENDENGYPVKDKEIKIFAVFASKVSTRDGITITRNRGFVCDADDPDNMLEGRVDEGGAISAWEIDGVQVIDEDGDMIGEDELNMYISNIDAFESIDFTEFELPVESTK